MLSFFTANHSEILLFQVGHYIIKKYIIRYYLFPNSSAMSKNMIMLESKIKNTTNRYSCNFILVADTLQYQLGNIYGDLYIYIYRERERERDRQTETERKREKEKEKDPYHLYDVKYAKENLYIYIYIYI